MSLTEDEKLLFQRQQSRLGELEFWLAMLIARHGVTTPTGHKYVMCAEHAAELRNLMPRAECSVSIDYDMQTDTHVLDAL